MQSNAFHLSSSSSTLLLQRRRTTTTTTTTTTTNNKPLLSIRNPNPSFSSSFKPVVLKSSSINGVVVVSVTRSSSLYSSCFNKNSNSHHSTIVSSYGGGNELSSVEEEEEEKKATAVPPPPESIVESSSSSSSSSESKKFSKTLELVVLIAFWYMSNIYFNIFNKQVLKVYPYPMTLSAFQLSAGTVLSLLMWTFNLYKRPNVTTSQLLAILPLAIVHTMGNLFTNMSLGKVSVSFTHTIKAMEPFFSVLLSALFLGEQPSFWVVASLVPVVGGVALASLTEASFNWIGFWSAMASNLTNQSRNVFSKKIMGKKEEALDNITLFSIMTIMSFFLTVPVALLIDGVKFTPSYLQASGLDVRELCVRCLLLGFFFHTYQQLSYMILERLSPVTHSVSNSVKRVVVIVSSVLFFRTPVSPINAIGTGIALAGVFLYSRVKQIKPKEKPKTV